MVIPQSQAARQGKGHLDQVFLIFLPLGVTFFWKVGIHLLMDAGVSVAITRKQVTYVLVLGLLQAMHI